MSSPTIQPGDVILFQGRGLFARLIRFGQRLRYPRNPEATVWSHAALAISATEIVEAVGEGVRVRHFDPTHERLPFLVLPIQASAEDRAEAAAFAESQVGHAYDWLDIASIALTFLTGSRVDVSTDGSFICSWLVGEALERTRIIWSGSPSRLTPAALYLVLKEHFHA